MIDKNRIPQGWEIVKHSEVAEINPKLPFKNVDDDTEVSFLPMKLIEEEKNVFYLTEFRKYKDVKKGFTPVTDGDVIFAKITPCMENGKCAILHDLKNGIGFGSTEFHVSRARECVIAKYIFYFIIQRNYSAKIFENLLDTQCKKSRHSLRLEVYIAVDTAAVADRKCLCGDVWGQFGNRN